MRCAPAAEDEEGRWEVEIATPAGREGREMLRADFVADATGRSAHLARRLGARRLRYDRLVGAAALMAGAPASQDSYTLVEAVPTGWWYSALMADGRMAVAFLTDGDLLDRGFRGPQGIAAWRAALAGTRETRERVGDAAIADSDGLRILPAESSRLDRISGDGWLAVGDAAAAYDPLSSHGIGSAMASGFYAGNAIADSLAGKEEAVPAYLDLLQRAYGACLDLQRRHYGEERRWPASPFWRRRQTAGYCLEPAGALEGIEKVYFRDISSRATAPPFITRGAARRRADSRWGRGAAGSARVFVFEVPGLQWDFSVCRAGP